MDIEESAATNTIVATGVVPAFSIGASTVALEVRNNTLVNTHTYTFTVVTASGAIDWSGCYIRVDDDITGNTIAYVGPGPAAAGWDIDNVIPGIRVTLTWVAQETAGSNTSTIAHTTDPVIAEYLFVCDAGNDRIKIIKGADNGEAVTNGTDSDFFAGDQRTDHYWISDGATASQSFVAAVRAEENSFILYTGDADGRTQWTQVDDFSGSTSSSNHYMFDYDTRVITLGDGDFGAVPDVSDTVLAVYDESIDVLNYGSTGTGSGKFNSPSGISARYNAQQGWYDVYVSDTDNGRIVKLKFYPGSTSNPASVTWVTSWQYASSSGDLLSNPTDLAWGIDGANKVYLFVCDNGNDRIVVFRDQAAEPTGDGGNDAPTYSNVIGGSGMEFGFFSNPIGVSVTNNGNDLDVYIVDSHSGYVQKFEEGLTPFIDIDYGNIVAAGYPPEGSYTFEATGASFAQNAPEGSYIQFYYSDSLNAASPILCSNTEVLPDLSEFVWVFNTTPSGTPGDDTYYLYARLFNSSGTMIAEDNTVSGQEFVIDSDLSQGLSIFDPLDDDRYLNLQNGAQRVVQFTVDYPDSIVAVNFNGTFSPSVMEIISISEGPAWQSIQNNGTIFVKGFNNTTGTFNINTSVLGSNTGLYTSGVKVVAIATIKAKSSVITTTNRYNYSALSLNSGGMTDVYGADVSSAGLRNLNLRLAYLGDIARSDSSSGSVPNMVPMPDGAIGFPDLVAFTLGWNGMGGMRDPIADLGPVSGSTPNLISNPDGKWDVYDLVAFTQMFSWYLSQGFSSFDGFGIALGGDNGMLGWESNRSGEEYQISLKANGVIDLMSAKLTLDYNPEFMNLSAVEEGSFLKQDAQTIFAWDENDGCLEIYISRFSQTIPSVSGSGTLAKVIFTLNSDDVGILEIGYDLRSSSGEVIEEGAYTLSDDGIPETFKLCQNYPNPFNSATMIDFQLPSASQVKMDIYNINGRLVNTLVDSFTESGYHQVEWNGRDREGNPLSSGIYFYTIEADNFHQVKKMILLK